MAITGHSSRSTFDRYNTVGEADQHRAIERLEVFSEKNSQKNSKRKRKTRPKPGS